MEAIGGYFSLELPSYKEYHENAIKLNTGRNSLEYILCSHKYTKVYIPYYTCEVVLEPLNKLGIAYAFYHINFDFELTDVICLKKNEALLYTNYYGLKQRYVEKLALQYGSQLIVDNTQAFYAEPVNSVSTFYTCRKFFGVPDGAYLYTDIKLDIELKRDISYDHTTFLTKRIDLGAEAGYTDYRKQDDGLTGLPIKLMSRFTERMMRSIDYEDIKHKRRVNYMQLHNYLGTSNLLQLTLELDAVPMIYPYFVNKDGLRQHLIQNKIFVAKYWPNIEEWVCSDSIESHLASYMIPLPIDQRYGEEEMKYVIEIMQDYEQRK